jgi:hypothetical protein
MKSLDYNLQQDPRRSGRVSGRLEECRSEPEVFPRKEFRRYTLGLASMDDRLAIRAYFQAMLSSQEPPQSSDRACSQRELQSKAPIAVSLEKLGYTVDQHPTILGELTRRSPRRDMRVRVASCCECRPDATSMLIEIERADGHSAPIKLFLDADRPWTIGQLKEKIVETQEGACCYHCCHESETDDGLRLMQNGRELDDTQIVANGDKLQLNENGITFKKLAAYHAQAKKRLDLQSVDSTSGSVGGESYLPLQQLVQRPHKNTRRGKGIEEPLIQEPICETRPASPDANGSTSTRLMQPVSVVGNE